MILLLMVFLGACARPPVVPSPLQTASWSALPGWTSADPTSALEAFRQSCRAVGQRPQWAAVCADAATLDPADPAVVRAFFEKRFTPYRVVNPDGTDTGLITGYYAPELRGSRVRTDVYRYPLYGVPDDLLVVDLGDLYPQLGDLRLRGRLVGRRIVPYWDRSQIDGSDKPLKGDELFWVADPVSLFFLQIQGSGVIRLPDGEQVMVGYADQNGYPYRSIGRLLIERGAMTRDQMSMQNIRDWARKYPEDVGALLAENPSYVFFHILPSDTASPPGALGVPLTAGRSLAVDPRTIPLGAPVFVATTWPCSETPLTRLMVAQDTGGAIKGAVRADFYWGIGDGAGEMAGRMKQPGQLWVLLPSGVPTASFTRN
jgi:membrane-bound lytic murein transglycosylase A